MLPGLAFGLWALTQKFPKTQADALGISFKDMMSADEADTIRAYVVDRLIKDKATALAAED